jgi:hypothetical protein
MSTFRPGDRVRCVVRDGSNLLVSGTEYTIAEYDAQWTMLRLAYSTTWFAQQLFEPVADEQPGAVQPTYKYDKATRTIIVTEPLPATAQAILDIAAQAKQPAPRAADERGSGVARAVARLSEREPRLGCHAWRP